MFIEIMHKNSIHNIILIKCRGIYKICWMSFNLLMRGAHGEISCYTDESIRSI